MRSERSFRVSGARSSANRPRSNANEPRRLGCSRNARPSAPRSTRRGRRGSRGTGELQRERAARKSATDAEAARSRQLAELDRELEGVRARSSSLESDLTAQRAAAAEAATRRAELETDLGAQRAAAAELATRHAELETDLDVQRTAAAEMAARHAQLETDLRAQHAEAAEMAASHAELETTLAAHRAAAAEAATTQAALERELAEARQAAETRLATDGQAHRNAIAALEHRIEELEESGTEARARASDVVTERDALTAALEAERQKAADASAAADARLSAVDAERVEAERAWLEAEARVTEATAERDRLASRIAAAGEESAGHRATVETLERRVTELEESIADRDELASRLSAAAGETAEQLATTAALSRRIAELEEAANAAIARESAAVRDRDALSAAFDVERKQTAAAWADADARLTVIDGELAAAEQARLEAEERAEEAVADRDELGSRLAAAVKSVQGMNAAVDERLAAIDAKRARALQQAQERAEAATRERDALAAELAALASAPAAAADPDSAQQLEVALERIHALELQLFARDRGPRDADVELGSLLPPEAVPPIERGGTPAKRYGFKPLKRVQVDRAPALLVDLSLTGAQVIFATSPEVGTMVTLTLLSDDESCFCQGRLLWARREQTAKGRPYRYPAGIAFTSVDNAAVEAFIAEHAVDLE